MRKMRDWTAGRERRSVKATVESLVLHLFRQHRQFSSEALGAIQEISIVGSENCKAATPPPGQWQGCRGSGEKGHHRHHWGKDSLLLAWRNTKLTKTDQNWPKLTKTDQNWPKLTKTDQNWPKLTKLTKLTKFLPFFCRPLLHRMLQQPPQRCRDAIFATEVVET